jgi:hypothetical protein
VFVLSVTWMSIVKHDVRVPSSASASIHESMPGSSLENVPGGVDVSVLGSILESVWRSTWERTVKQAGSGPSSATARDLESMHGRVLENVLGGVHGSNDSTSPDGASLG